MKYSLLYNVMFGSFQLFVGDPVIFLSHLTFVLVFISEFNLIGRVKSITLGAGEMVQQLRYGVLASSFWKKKIFFLPCFVWVFLSTAL